MNLFHLIYAFADLGKWLLAFGTHQLMFFLYFFLFPNWTSTLKIRSGYKKKLMRCTNVNAGFLIDSILILLLRRDDLVTCYIGC